MQMRKHLIQKINYLGLILETVVEASFFRLHNLIIFILFLKLKTKNYLAMGVNTCVKYLIFVLIFSLFCKK